MQRKNGFLDLDTYFGKSYHELVSSGILKYDNSFEQYFDENEKKSNHWITIEGEEYYLKRSNYWEQELVVEEFFTLLGLSNLHYDVATLDGVEYVISKDYKCLGKKYITGAEILEDFYIQTKKTDNGYFKENFGMRLNRRKELAAIFLNNLENIWQALAFRYRNKTNKEKIVYKLVNDLKKRFLVRSILLNDADYHPNNWIIEEGSEIKLIPNFDNESTLMTDINGLPFGASIENVNDGAYAQLEYYLSVSDSANISEFLEIYSVATPELLKLAIDNVETKRGVVISRKYSFLENYTRNYENIKSLVTKYRGKYGR